jgi:hypothetical protein
MAAIAFEVHCSCPKCASPVPLNALVQKVTCGACQAEVDNPLVARLSRRSFHLGALEVLRHRSTEAGRRTASLVGVEPGRELEVLLNGRGPASFAGRVEWAEPSCPLCRGRLPLPEQLAAAAAAGRVVCPQCGEAGVAIVVRPVPRPLVPPHLDFVTHAIGEDPELLPGARANVAAPSAAKPVLFPCPACNASLPVDGTSRTVECTYCRATAYLPDDLWRRLHPPRRIERWYLWIEENSATIRRMRRAGTWLGLWAGMIFLGFGGGLGMLAFGLDTGQPAWFTYGISSALAALAVLGATRVGPLARESGQNER